MNLLLHPVFSIRNAGPAHPAGSTSPPERVALPRLLARLLLGPEMLDFPKLAAEQRSYFWRFLVRCAARSLRTAGVDVQAAQQYDVTTLEEMILSALIKHTSLHDWELHQPDPSLAGFLQPPTPQGKPPHESGYRHDNCALLTAIIGTKEHERKSQKSRTLDAEALAYALIEFQIGVIFGGRGNYESQLTGSRSGAGSGTPFMGLQLDRSLVKTFRHDVAVMLEKWGEVARELSGDTWALWTLPWDGEARFPSQRLDPAFIPFGRSVRVGKPRDGVFDTVWFRPSNAARVLDHTDGGRLGDVFTPLVNAPGGVDMKVRGVLERGFDYVEVVKLLFPADASTAKPSASVEEALQQAPDFEDVRVVFEGTAFEQGKTRGFHRRVVELPKQARQSNFFHSRIEPLHRAHAQMLDATGRAKRALRSALTIVLTGEPRPRDEDRRKTGSCLEYLEALVDRNYLDKLFEAAQLEESDDPTRGYRDWLFEVTVQQAFPRGINSLPRTEGRRLERQVNAEAYLRGRLRKELALQLPTEAKEVA